MGMVATKRNDIEKDFGLRLNIPPRTLEALGLVVAHAATLEHMLDGYLHSMVSKTPPLASKKETNLASFPDRMDALMKITTQAYGKKFGPKLNTLIKRGVKAIKAGHKYAHGIWLTNPKSGRAKLIHVKMRGQFQWQPKPSSPSQLIALARRISGIYVAISRWGLTYHGHLPLLRSKGGQPPRS